MGKLQIRKKSKFFAPARIAFTKQKNEHGAIQHCVYAQCQYSGCIAGPAWGHKKASVARALMLLTRACACQRPYHKSRGSEGERVLDPT